MCHDFDFICFLLAEQLLERLDPLFDKGDRCGDPADPLTRYVLKQDKKFEFPQEYLVNNGYSRIIRTWQYQKSPISHHSVQL